MQCAPAVATPPFVPREWMRLMPSTPLLSSDALGWRRISAYRVKYPARFCVDLPAVRGPFLSAHLRNPCLLSTRWNGKLRSSRSLPGETIIMSANQENSWVGDGEIDELQIFLDPQLIREASAELSDRSVDLLEGIGIRDPVMTSIATRLVEELSNPGRCSAMIGDAMAQALTAQLLSRHSTLRAAARIERIDMPAHKVRAAIEYIETHLGDDMSIDSIASALGMSSFRFARGFAKGTGQSPHQFLLTRRIELAQDLLRSTDRKLADIARAVGFSTQSHFTVVFGKRCQMTPLAYRRFARGNA